MSLSNCILCGSGNGYSIVYDGQIRNGDRTKYTVENYKVVECLICKVQRLEPFCKIDYSTSEYRRRFIGSGSTEDYMRLHDWEQTGCVTRLGLEQLRNKRVADLGCGGGSFLDTAKGFAEKTIAVKPYIGYYS